MTAISGYNAYTQPLIQERVAQQTPSNSRNSAEGTDRSSAVKNREELFKSILAESQDGADKSRVRSPEERASTPLTSSRGQVVDLTV